MDPDEARRDLPRRRRPSTASRATWPSGPARWRLPGRAYDGDASRIWREASDGADLYARLLDLPGFGPMKAETLVAILGKRLGVAPAGWEAFVPDHMTLGDVD